MMSKKTTPAHTHAHTHTNKIAVMHCRPFSFCIVRFGLTLGLSALQTLLRYNTNQVRGGGGDGEAEWGVGVGGGWNGVNLRHTKKLSPTLVNEKANNNQ